MLLAKIALGLGGTIVLAGAYAFHEGVLRVSVDEQREGGTHMNLVLPAALVLLAVHAVPQQDLENALRDAGDALPALRKLAKELRNYPDSDFVEVRDSNEHVRMRTRSGKLQIDVETPQKKVRLACPLAAINGLAEELEARRPGA